MSPAPVQRRGTYTVGCLVLSAVSITVVLALMGLASRQEADRKAADPLIGQTRTVTPDCTITVFRDDGDLTADTRAWADPQAVKDGAPGLLRAAAVRAGRAWIPSPGTRLRIEDHERYTLTVQIVDGIAAGHIGKTSDDRCLR